MVISPRNRSRVLNFSTWIVLGFLASCTHLKNVTILHTNDIHANFLPHEALWIKHTPKPLIGGFNELAYAIDSLRYVKKSTLLLDAGDVMTGNPITEYDYRGASGGALFEMMNFVGYDAWTPGNHEFDISVDNCRRLTEIAKFPTTSANLLDTSGTKPVNNVEYLIFEKNGVKIGIIGLMSSDFHNLVNKTGSESIKILPPIETVQRLVDTLRPHTDLLVALTHEGVGDDSVLAMNIHGLNVVVGGHSHTRLKHPTVVNNVIIVQAGSNCENVGILDLTIEHQRVVEHKGELLPLWYNSTRGTTPLSLFIDSLKDKIDSDYAEVIGILKTDWIRNNRGESGIGDFIADAQREAAGADFGFMNNQGIRKDILAGPITKRDLFEILPFRNILAKFEITGKQIREIVRFELEKGPAIQTSGVRCEWRRGPGGEIEFISFLINGKSLEEDKLYSGAASDYLLGEAPKYFGFEILKITYLDKTVRAVVEDKIRTMKEISSVIEHRIKQAQ